jgi:hypothetical protein
MGHADGNCSRGLRESASMLRYLRMTAGPQMTQMTQMNADPGTDAFT